MGSSKVCHGSLFTALQFAVEEGLSEQMRSDGVGERAMGSAMGCIEQKALFRTAAEHNLMCKRDKRTGRML